jgi:regulatory protein
VSRPPSRPDPEHALRNRALGLLARREHSRRELARKLAGAADAQLTALLDTLAADGLQSDSRYAEQFVASRAERGHGPLRIRHDLRQRGVAEALVEAAFAAADVDWEGRLEAVRRKRFGDPLPAGRDARARQARFLAQRGFTAEQIHKRLTDTE